MTESVEILWPFFAAMRKHPSRMAASLRRSTIRWRCGDHEDDVQVVPVSSPRGLGRLGKIDLRTANRELVHLLSESRIE